MNSKLLLFVSTLVVCASLVMLSACAGEEETQVLDCGETASFEKADITVGEPTSCFVVYKSNASLNDAQAYIRFPITIEAHDDVSFDADDFGSVELDYDENFINDVLYMEPNCMPETIDLKDGDKYEGVLCILWYRAGPTEWHEAPNIVECDKWGFGTTWNVNYPTDTITLKKLGDIDKLLPNTHIKAKVTVDSVGYLGATVYDDDGRNLNLKVAEDLYMLAYIPGEDIAYWEELEESGKSVTIEAVVRNMTKEAGGNEPIISRCIVLSDLEIK